MKQPSFALITLDYPPERGGVARYLGDLVTTADDEMDVYVPENHATTGPGVVRELPMFRPGPWSWRAMILSFWKLRRKGYRALFLSHLLPVGTAAMMAHWFGGLPYGLLVHGLDIRLASSRWHRRLLAKVVLLQAKTVYANSEAVAKEIRLLAPSIYPLVVTPGMLPRRFSSHDEARNELNLSDEAFVCLTVARLVPRKGIDTMIRLLKNLPSNVEYVVIGDGQDKERLLELMQKEGVTRVQFLSGLNDEDRDRWFAAADLFVFLAREEGRDLEGFGIAPLEASAAGLPVLAGRTGGVAEAVLDEETGLLVDPTNLDEVRQAFTRLYGDAELRSRLGRQGQVRAQTDFTWQARWDRIRTSI